MNRGSTIFLRGVVFLIGFTVLALSIFWLPGAIRLELAGDFDYGPILLGLYVPALPFFIALYQALKLLDFIDKNEAFSKVSVSALRNIKYCAIIIGALFMAGMPYIYFVADKDDALGVVALGLVILGASFVIATFAAVLQKLVQNAVDIKKENDLTV